MKTLKASAITRVRFDEVDSMGIVWHGSYVKYFEDARVAFGQEHSLGYMDIFSQGYYAPLVNMDFKFVSPLVFGDSVIAEAEYVPCEGSKIIFKYTLRKESDGALVATGTTTQVFLDRSRQLALYPPQFYIDWRKEHGVQI